MNARDAMARQLTHRLASEIHRALADSNMSIAELALKIGDTAGHLRRVLAGEDGIADHVKLRILSDVVWATGEWCSISISPQPPIPTHASVQPGGDA